QDNVPVIHVEVNDPDPTGQGCNVGAGGCEYWYYLDDDKETKMDHTTNLSYSFDITFPEDTMHELHILCHDALGNVRQDIETFYVDSQPPNTTKVFDGPNKIDGEVEWIDGVTKINLTAVDYPDAVCKSGVDKTYYRIVPMDDDTCWSPGCYCYPIHNSSDEGWTEYTGPIGGINESCHMIEYYSVDKLGNTESVKTNCFFVDKTPPNVWAEVGTPKLPGDGETFDYWVTQNTSIDLYCEDQGPHPSGDVHLYYKIWDDVSQTWTEWQDTVGQIVHKEVYFNEDSLHKLQYKCVDAVNKSDGIHELTFKVDTTPPNVTKVLKEPYYGECPPRPDSNDTCFVDTATRIFLNTTDGGNVCHVDNVSCQWRYRVEHPGPLMMVVDDGDGWSGWIDYNDSEGINFPEECYHELEVRCEDALGNRWDDTEHFIVDKTSPEILKVYGQPRYPVEIRKDILCYKDSDSNWQCYTELAQALENIGYTELPMGSLEYKASGPVLEITVKLSGLKPETEYQLTLNGRNGNDGNDELAYNCPNPNGPKEGYEYAWECGYWTGETGQEGFWNFDMTATTDGDGDYEKTYFLEMPEGHYGIGPAHDFGFGFIVKEAADAPGGSNYPPILMEYHGLDWTVEPYQHPMWITSNTSVYLSARDPEPHPSGLANLEYRITLVDDSYCWNDTLCQDEAEGSGDWTTISSGDKTNIPEESCHLIEIRATDNVNKSSLHKQCVFVDNSAPTPEKTVGDPKDEWTPGLNGDPESYFYPEANTNCWNESSENPLDCWQVTTMTPISLDCSDPEPHPVNHESVCFNVGWDGEDITANYCEGYNGDYNETGDGFCCVDHTIVLYFHEETEHELEYYCMDALGNTNKQLDIEKFKVGGTKFEIPLFKKWNLISVPFVLLNDNPTEVFKDVESDVDAVWTYDGVTGQWYVYTPDGDSANDNLDSIQPGWGYWVHANKEDCEDPTVLEIGGSLFNTQQVPPSRQLVKGWNLIGKYGTNWQEYDEMDDMLHVCGDRTPWPWSIYGDNAYCSLETLVDTTMGYTKWQSLWGYINCCGPEGDQWAALGWNSTMYDGRGYWVDLGEEDLYNPPSHANWCNLFGDGRMPPYGGP
ncbi:MAG: hypothetical protein J7L23_05460, partial [Candidatus Diapherotrites archaeon]|nr:hypothetical protein [Candidatus Diapherotrites archaeon]